MKLPPLREELRLTEGPRSHDGQPGWTLHDPTRSKFFRLDWPTFEILKRWSMGGPDLIARLVGEQTTLRMTSSDVMGVAEFLQQNQLLKTYGADNSASLAGLQGRARPGFFTWLVHNYLFFRVPLINPAGLLRRADRTLGFLFRRGFWLLTAAALVVGLALLWRNWAEFKAAWVDFADFHGVLGYVCVLIAVKVIHECGHGLVATHYGCRVPAMGIAFLVMTPVAYTDTNEAWLLTRRRPRLLIGGAGIIAELTIAAWATLAWGLLPDGFWRSAAYMLATVTWIKSLLVNLSPVMRFDGYYLMSDALDLPNLHTRAFALARWRLREWLFDLREQPPEYFRRPLGHGLVALAVVIWIYRLIVFTGIAIFVYHFFFKALGIVLFLIEILWFVVIPIFSEMKVWFEKRAAILKSRRARWPALVLAVLLVLACVPLPQRVKLSAQLYPSREHRVVTAESARLARLDFADGARVAEGAELLCLESPALVSHLAETRARLAKLEARHAAAAANPEERAMLPVMTAELATARAAVAEAGVLIARLTPTAPFGGRFFLADIDLKPGEWLGKGELVGVLADGDAGWTAVAYLDEKHAHLVAEGQGARFYPEGRAQDALRMRVVSIELDATRALPHPLLHSAVGGDVQARVVDNELVPEKSVYRVIFTVEPGDAPDDLRIRRGRLVVRAEAESLAARFGRKALSVLWRELGF